MPGRWEFSAFRELRFVLSHPCARKKAQGWGTVQIWQVRLGNAPFFLLPYSGFEETVP